MVSSECVNFVVEGEGEIGPVGFHVRERGFTGKIKRDPDRRPHGEDHDGDENRDARFKGFRAQGRIEVG